MAPLKGGSFFKGIHSSSSELGAFKKSSPFLSTSGGQIKRRNSRGGILQEASLMDLGGGEGSINRQHLPKEALCPVGTGGDVLSKGRTGKGMAP